MTRKNTAKPTVYPIRMEEDLKNRYLKFCTENSFTMAVRLRFLMNKDMKNKIKILK